MVTSFPVLTLLLFALRTDDSSSLSSNPHIFGQTQRVGRKPPTPKVTAAPKKDDPEKLIVSPDDKTVDAFIRSEYQAWVLQHNKTEDDDRYEIFKGNFLATLKAYEATGEYHALNKYADLTEEEYKQAPAPVDEVDAYVRSEYEAWVQQYGKTPDEKRYAIFKTNFLMTMKIFEETGKFNALNEHGDMSREEYLRMQTKLAMSNAKPGGNNGQQQWGENRYDTIPPSSGAETQSYPRSSAMTFTPVTPRSTSDVLNNSGGGGGGGGMGMEWGGGPAWGGGGGGYEWGGGSGGDPWADGGGGDPWRASPPTYAPSMAPPPAFSPAPFQRPSGMTFTPVTAKSTSDMLNNNRGSPSPYGDEWGGGGSGGGWGGQETMAPMVGPPSFSGPPPQDPYASAYGPPPPQQQDPYASSASSYDFSRPSSMTFTPVTPQSTSDVLNNKPSSDPEWGFGGNEWGFSPSRAPPSPPSQPYVPQNPPGATFKSITQSSVSDMRNRNGSGRIAAGGGRPTSSSSSSYASSYTSPGIRGKPTFSYMPNASIDSGLKNGQNGPSSFMNMRGGGPSSRDSSSNNNSRNNRSENNKKGDSRNDSLWDKMASAVEAIAGGGAGGDGGPKPLNGRNNPPGGFGANGRRAADSFGGLGREGDPAGRGPFPF